AGNSSFAVGAGCSRVTAADRSRRRRSSVAFSHSVEAGLAADAQHEALHATSGETISLSRNLVNSFFLYLLKHFGRRQLVREVTVSPHSWLSFTHCFIPRDSLEKSKNAVNDVGLIEK